MNVKEALQAVLSQPVMTPSDADRAREAAELLSGYLRLEAAAERLVGEADNRTTPPTTRGSDLLGSTLHDAERVLEAAGVPLHVKELGARIKGRGWRHPRSSNARPDQILFQLAARLPRYPETFQRVAPNTFGLSRWSSSSHVQHPRPKTSIFRGPADATGRAIGESDEPLTGPDSSWRSS